MNKKCDSRNETNEKEGTMTVNNEVPDNRMQGDQEVGNNMQADETKVPQSGFGTVKSVGKGSELKQTKISDVLTGSADGQGMGISAGGRGVSGTVGGILGANNSTPQAGTSRSGSRPAKKLDRIAQKLNYTPCERPFVPFDESKPLAHAAADDQGFNGTYRNANARSQKLMGAVPADLMFVRSVDYDTKDGLYFLEGQQVFQEGDSTTDYNPDKTYDLEAKELKDIKIHTGNYLHRNLHFGLNEQGKVEYFYADVENITPPAQTSDNANLASAHRLTKSNVAELDRQQMDAKAGDEKADNWTPLARAVNGGKGAPTKWSYFLSSMEAETGGYVMLAISKGCTNMAHQLNRAKKDGLDAVTPAIEELVGWRSTIKDSVQLGQAYDNSLHSISHPIFSQENYRKGDPALMIEYGDSVNKYNTKADLLLQSKSFRQYITAGLNNSNVLRVPKEFVDVFTGNETYSTINHEYDPLLPICITDKTNLVLIHNLNEVAGFDKFFGARSIKFKFDTTKVSAVYEGETYRIMRKNGGKILKAFGYGESAYLLYKKTQTSGTAHSLNFDSATGVVYVAAGSGNAVGAEYEIILSQQDTVAGYTKLSFTKDGQTVYDFAQYDKDIVINIPTNQNTDDNVITNAEIEEISDERLYHKDSAPLAYYYHDERNPYVVEVKHPLVFGIIQYLEKNAGGKIRKLIGQTDFMVPMVFSTQHMTLAQLLIPAAASEIQHVRENTMEDVLYYESNNHEYPYSQLVSLKDANYNNFVNFTYTDFDTQLDTKVMQPAQAIRWTLPEFLWKIDTGVYVLPWYFNESDLDADGNTRDNDTVTMSMPSIRSGIRLANLDALYGMSEKDIRLSLDRITKAFLDNDNVVAKYAYKYGRTTDGQVIFKMDTDKVITVRDFLAAPRELGLLIEAPLGVLTPSATDGYDLDVEFVSTSHRVRCYANTAAVKEPTILSDKDVNIKRAADYTQKWFELTCDVNESSTEINGLIFACGDDSAEFTPIAELGSGEASSENITLISYQRSIYTRLQLLPYLLSPFDAVASAKNGFDIYDFIYYFGCAGFRASDYAESVYNRSEQVVEQGNLFIHDPWVEASPIVKRGASNSGVKETRGYEVQ